MRLFVFLKELHDKIAEHSKKLTFDKKHALHRNLVALYGSLIELTAGIIILIDRKARTGVPPLFRTFLETYVEFRNLVADPKYGYFMDASYHDQWLKVLREAEKGANPYLADIAKLPNLVDHIRHTERELETLKKKSYFPLSVFKKFECAGMVSEYRSLYNFLSADSHSNIRALINRHIELGKEDFEIVFYKDTPLEDFLTFIDSTCGLLIDASIRIHEYLNSPVVYSIRSLQEKLQEIRKQV
jgi:hypothetical protein